MFTSAVTVVVVALAIVGATVITVKDPEQPATLRTRRRRERPPGRPPGRAKTRVQQRPAPAPRPAPTSVPTPRAASPWPGAVPAPADGTGFTDHWVPAPVGHRVWIRLRSGVVLTVLLAIVGALIALSVAGVIVFIALALRSAVS